MILFYKIGTIQYDSAIYIHLDWSGEVDYHSNIYFAIMKKIKYKLITSQ